MGYETPLLGFDDAVSVSAEERMVPDGSEERVATAMAEKLFGEEPEMPPTWAEGGAIFHTTEKCTRLQAIRRNRRVTGKPGAAMRPCFNCEDILRTKRRG